ncbi:unnamed protein product, partial [Ectocarpus sp. 6 AP-2014]
MSSSSDEDFRSYHRPYPLHDAAEAGDMETLTQILRPRQPKKPASISSAAGGGEGEAAAGGDGRGGVAPMDEEGDAAAAAGTGGGEADGGAGKARAEAEGNENNSHRHPAGGGDDESSDDDDDDELGGFRPPSVDLEERDHEGCTPLHVALTAKNLDAARLLLECGAGTTRRLEGSTPAHVALSVASVGRHRGFANAALKLLLEYHHDVSVKDDRGQTLLHLAASFGLDDAMATLLEAPGGRELMDSKERLSCRPLHLAALAGHVGATRALISAGCDASFTNLHGNTALHLACSKARWEVARVLLEDGKASVVACNKNKQTPAAVALKQGLRIPDTLPELHEAAATATATIGNGDSTNGTTANPDQERGSSSSSSSSNRGKVKKKAKWEFPVAGGSGRGDDTAAAAGNAVGNGGIRQAGAGAAAGGGGGGGAAGAPKTRTAVLHHPLCLQHHSCPPIRRWGADPPPENVKRLEVIYNEDSGVLRADEFSGLEWDSNPSRAELADVLRVHDFNYVEKLERLCSNIPGGPGSLSHLDGDTAVSHDSFEAALRAAGSVCDGVDRVMTGRNRNAFCAVRPPGHHAGTRGLVTCANDGTGSHGFCLLNNVAIGAAYARCVHRHTGVERVAIVDFDVHHGNGTEAIVKALVPKVEEASIKTPFCQGLLQQPLVLDVGMPLPEIGDTPGASRHRWRDVYRKDILPKLVAFNPDIILVSAGFDAHKKDVINYGYIGLLEEDYEWVTQQLVQVANRCCEGRLVSVLEGGYRIQGGIVSAFGRSVAGHVRALVDGCESRQA